MASLDAISYHGIDSIRGHAAAAVVSGHLDVPAVPPVRAPRVLDLPAGPGRQAGRRAGGQAGEGTWIVVCYSGTDSSSSSRCACWTSRRAAGSEQKGWQAGSPSSIGTSGQSAQWQVLKQQLLHSPVVALFAAAVAHQHHAVVQLSRLPHALQEKASEGRGIDSAAVMAGSPGQHSSLLLLLLPGA